MEWLNWGWLLQAFRLGLRYIAHVVRANKHQEVLTLKCLAPAEAGLKLPFFGDPTSAQEWLRAYQQPVAARAWPPQLLRTCRLPGARTASGWPLARAAERLPGWPPSTYRTDQLAGPTPPANTCGPAPHSPRSGQYSRAGQSGGSGSAAGTAPATRERTLSLSLRLPRGCCASRWLISGRLAELLADLKITIPICIQPLVYQAFYSH